LQVVWRIFSACFRKAEFQLLPVSTERRIVDVLGFNAIVCPAHQPARRDERAVVLHLCQSEAQAELTARFFSCKP
jgi:hypothetical protein